MIILEKSPWLFFAPKIPPPQGGCPQQGSPYELLHDALSHPLEASTEGSVQLIKLHSAIYG